MKHKNILITAAIVVLFGGATGTAAVIKHVQADNPTSTTSVHANHTLSYQGQTGKTALALLKTHAQVTVKNSSYGPFVESIDGVTGGGKYWMFYVNGKEATVGAASYATKNGDKIEWKFE